MPAENIHTEPFDAFNDMQKDLSAHVTDFADVTMERYMDLNAVMIRNKPSTFFFQDEG